MDFAGFELRKEKVTGLDESSILQIVLYGTLNKRVNRGVVTCYHPLFSARTGCVDRRAEAINGITNKG